MNLDTIKYAIDHLTETRREEEILKLLARGLRPKEAVAVAEVDKNGIDDLNSQEIRKVVEDIFGDGISPTAIRKCVMKSVGENGIDQNEVALLFGLERVKESQIPR